MKAISINVYKSGNYDCTNGGISSKHNTLLLVHEHGWIDIDENNPPENAVKLVVRNLWGKEYKHLEPMKLRDSNGTDYMFGGNLAYGSDSRFSELSAYPLKIHDRQETWEMYDRLSR